MRNHDFKFIPSQAYLILLAAVYIMSMGAILYLPIYWVFKLILAFGASIYARSIMIRYGILTHPQSILSLSRDEDGAWRIKTKQNLFLAELSPQSIVSHLVSVLIFKSSDQKITLNCIIFRDALPQDEYRKLLVLLRMF